LDRETHWSDTFHFKGEAKRLQAKAVGDCVRKALGVGKASGGSAPDQEGKPRAKK